MAFDDTLRMIRHPQRGLDDFLLVSEEAMDHGVELLLEHTHNLAERAGAASLAAALQIKERLARKNVVIVLSGGNLSMEQLRNILCP